MSLVEEAIDAADAAGCAVAVGEFITEAGAGQDGVLRAQFLDQGEYPCSVFWELGRAGHDKQCT